MDSSRHFRVDQVDMIVNVDRLDMVDISSLWTWFIRWKWTVLDPIEAEMSNRVDMVDHGQLSFDSTLMAQLDLIISGHHCINWPFTWSALLTPNVPCQPWLVPIGLNWPRPAHVGLYGPKSTITEPNWPQIFYIKPVARFPLWYLFKYFLSNRYHFLVKWYLYRIYVIIRYLF